MRTILASPSSYQIPIPRPAAPIQVYDETTTIDGLPDQRFGPSLLLSTGGRVEVWLSLDPAGRVQGGQGTMSLLGDSLFTPMSDAERLAWAEVCNTCPPASARDGRLQAARHDRSSPRAPSSIPTSPHRCLAATKIPVPASPWWAVALPSVRSAAGSGFNI